MDDLQAKLNSIEERHSQLLTETPSDHHKKKVAEAYDTLLSAKSDLEQTPFRVKNAEKQYYTLKYGADGYSDFVKSSAQTQANAMKQKFIQAHNKRIADIQLLLDQFQTLHTYVGTMADTELIQCANINRRLANIRQEDAQTNLRRMYFLNLEQSTLDTWIQRLNYFIVAFALHYAFVQRATITEPSSYGIPLVLLFIVFAFSSIVNFSFNVGPLLNSYSNWGYDPSESKIWWYVFIPVGMACLWAILSYFE
jgi:hypothetical protein